MEIIFLGTSEATPTAKKSQAAMLLKYKNENILVDCGEGTQRQFKIANLNICKITRILITHWHGDHVLGLPGMLQTLALNNYGKTLHIYGPRGTKQFIQLFMKMFIFKESIKIEVHELIKDGVFLETKDFAISAFKMEHFTPCVAYRFAEKDQRKINMNFLNKKGLKSGPLIGQIQQGKTITYKGRKISPNQATSIKKGKTAAFILDTLQNKNCILTAKDADILISEATFLESLHLDKAKERGHLTAKQAALIAKQAKAKALILMHISQRYSKNEQPILDEAKKIFKASRLAEDFMIVRL